MLQVSRLFSVVIAVCLATVTVMTIAVASPARAGVIFEYVGNGARAADVFGFIEFNDGVAATIGDTWQLSDVAAFELNHGVFSYSSLVDPGFLQDGPGEFGADNPFENFDILGNPVQFANSALALGDTIITIHKTASALLVNDLIDGIFFDDPVAINWSRVRAQIPVPATLGLLVGGLVLLGRARRRTH